MHYFPLDTVFLLIFFALIGVLIALIEVGIVTYAYEKLGIPRIGVYAFLLLSLLGSYVNIPVAEVHSTHVLSDRTASFFGMRYVIPPAVHQRTIVAVNVGGAVIPILVSVYLLVRYEILGRAAVAVAIVAVISYWVAEPVQGVGISMPVFVPPLVAAGVALMLGRGSAPPLAYVSGTMGTLIGADLFNLEKISTLGAPVVSIGGAGTFDGIFLTGILAVLLT